MGTEMKLEMWDIPGSYDIGARAMDPAKRTVVELILNIRGGALPDGHAVILHVMELELTKMGQLHMDISEPDPEDIRQLLVVPQDSPKHLNLRIDEARIVPQDGQLFEQRMVTF